MQTEVLPTLPPLAELLTLREIGERVGAAHSTMLEWIKRGVRSDSGRLVRLRAVRVGGRWVTCQSWLKRFVNDVNDTADIPVV